MKVNKIMELKTLAEVKHINSDTEVFNITKNEVLRQKIKSSEIDFEKIKCIENVPIESNVKFEKPDDYLVEKIIQQVEFLLSNANILKDKFLLKHMRRNKEGYISLKLISSLRKVKALSKDWRVVAYSLQKSQKLQVNEEMTKIKRIEPLSLCEALDSFRTVLVFHYLPGYWTPENMKKELQKLGTVMSIVMVNSKAEIWNETLKRTLELYEDIATFPFAVVTFETADESANAVLQTSHPTAICKIVPLVEDENKLSKSTRISSPKNGKGWSCKSKVLSIFDDKISSVEFKTNSEHSKLRPNSKDGGSILISKIRTVTQDDKCNNPNKFHQLQKESLNDLEDKQKPMFACTYRGDGPGNNGWVQRKHLVGPKKKPRVIVLRQPKGPDGTKGFQERRANAAE